MIENQEDRLDQKFQEEWRKWLNRPRRLSAREASLVILEKISQKPSIFSLRWLVPLGTTAALLLATLLLAPWRWERKDAMMPYSEGTSHLQSGEVLMWIDEKTPLYMTFSPPDQAGKEKKIL